MSRKLRELSPLLLTLLGCGVTTQDLGGAPPAAPAESAPSGGASLRQSGRDPGVLTGGTTARPRLEWLNPLPQGNRVNGMFGSGSADAWLVGDAGTIVHWNGQKWQPVYGDFEDLDLYAVWASGPDDVWIAGDDGIRVTDKWDVTHTHRLNVKGAIYHYDGRGFVKDPQIGDRRAHAIWGARSSVVFALLEDGVIARYDGRAWTTRTSPMNGVLRDVWGASAEDVWAVGDRSAILHYDGSDWSVVQDADDPANPELPAASTRSYYGVWGTGTDDVWLAWTAPITTSGFTTLVTGWSRWHGGRLQVTQLANTGTAVPTRVDDPLRRGHLVWGVSPTEAITLTPMGEYAQVSWFDGEKWTPEAWQTELGGAPRTVWGADSAAGVLLGGYGGNLVRFQSAATRRFSPLLANFTNDLISLSATSATDAWGVAYGATGGELVRWTTGGWSRVPVRTRDGDVYAEQVFARSSSDVWVSGTTGSGSVLARWNGSTWTALTAPPSGTSRVWISPTGAPWIATYEKVFRFDGAAWEELPLPDGETLGEAQLGGTSDTDVWLASGTPSTLTLYRWRPSGWERVHRELGPDLPTSIAVGGADDIWITTGAARNPRQPHGFLYHYDGSSLVPFVDIHAIAVWPRGHGSMFYLANEDYTTSAGCVLGRWDGQKSTILGRTGAAVWNLAATTQGLWVAGEGGSTLRRLFSDVER